MIRGRHPQPYPPPGSTVLPLSGAAAGRTAGGRREESSTSNDERLDWTVPQEKWWPSMRSIGLSCLTVVPHNWIMDYYWNSGDLDDSTMKPSSWGNRINRNWGFIYPETNQHHSSITLVLLPRPSKAHGFACDSSGGTLQQRHTFMIKCVKWCWEET
jgi:hypothetical protein